MERFIVLSLDTFETLHHLPDLCPDPINEIHYLSFEDVYETETTETFHEKFQRQSS